MRVTANAASPSAARSAALPFRVLPDSCLPADSLLPEQISHRRQLDPGVLQQFLQALDVTDPLPRPQCDS